MSRPISCEWCRQYILPRGNGVTPDGARFYHMDCYETLTDRDPVAFPDWREVQRRMDEAKARGRGA